MAQRPKRWNDCKQDTPKDDEDRKEGKVIMARKSKSKQAPGIYEREDRKGFWISWTDAQGRRRRRKTHAQNITQAKKVRAAELSRVEQAKALGFAPPGKETFAEGTKRYLNYQKARLTQ